MALQGTGSLIVPSVQELVKQPITKIPERYIHSNKNPVVESNTDSLPQVPVIDLSKLLSDDATELEKLDQSCREWGFFQLINHGVNTSLVENMKIGVEQFFNLPIEEKKEKFWQTPNDIQGFGQLFVVSDEQKLEWADMFYINTLPLDSRHPNLIPNIPKPFRDHLETYCLELKNIVITLIGHMEKALKIKTNELVEIFEDICQGMRMNYYPPCPQPEHVIGLNAHSDMGCLSIVLQANGVEGLQIRKDGQWISVQPLPNAFVINIGDMLEIFTNGIYRSIEHRGIVNTEKERISVATFHRLHVSRIIGPTPSLISPERPALFKPISVGDYIKTYLSHELKGKSHLDGVRIQNEIVTSIAFAMAGICSWPCMTSTAPPSQVVTPPHDRSFAQVLQNSCEILVSQVPVS
ncbi:hypothetical protein P8452_48157 [Trifolium repens]|nr:hypothetical protein P8452_48157 [Trifolium repens]